MTTLLNIDSYRVVKTDAAGAEYFEVRTVCTSAASPFSNTGIFLFKIYNSRDPGAYIFTRVCTVYDIENYKKSRAAAIAANEIYWRFSEFTVEYDALSTADQSTQIISDRVNTLSNDYDTYVSDFVASPETSAYPTSDPTYIQGLKTTYATAVTDFSTATTSAATAASVVSSAEGDVTSVQAILQEWIDEKDAVCGNGTTEVGLLVSMAEAHKYFEDLLDTSTETAGNSLAIIAAINTFITAFDNVRLSTSSVTTQKVTMSSTAYTLAVPEDIGKPVIDTTPVTPIEGILVSYDNASYTWWVAQATGLFANTMSVTGGAGSGTVTSSALGSTGPLEAFRGVLNTAKAAFVTTYDEAASHKSNIATGNANHIAK